MSSDLFKGLLPMPLEILWRVNYKILSAFNASFFGVILFQLAWQVGLQCYCPPINRYQGSIYISWLKYGGFDAYHLLFFSLICSTY